MASILTNNSAMVALQTLRSINSNLASTQAEISTGKSVASAKDNSAVWAISKQMESDVQGFKAISESLALGESTVAVARNASETVTDLLTDIKGKIVASQEDNVDRAKIQSDINALRDQIGAVVGAAQFNGLNLVNGSRGGNVSVLASLDRASDGTVSDSQISVATQNLGTNDATVDTAGTFAAGTASVLNTTQTQNFTIAAPAAAGQAYGIEITGGGTFATTYDTGTAQADILDIGYIAQEGDTASDVAAGLLAAFNAYATENGLAAADLGASVSGTTLTFTSSNTTAANTFSVAINTNTGDNLVAGGLNALSDVDVTTTEGADAALDSIETLIQTAIDASASFGSAQGRIETQAEFVSKLTDSLKSGIGALVDADLEEASARLQALQVQQQLGVQALSIANSAPQSILALFRG